MSSYMFFVCFFQKRLINEMLEKVQDKTFNCELFSVILVLLIY